MSDQQGYPALLLIDSTEKLSENSAYEQGLIGATFFRPVSVSARNYYSATTRKTDVIRETSDDS